jgi:hypothetical protein
MVFSINTNLDSAKSFAVFQANAEASIAPAAKVNKKPRRTPRFRLCRQLKVARK